MKYFLIVIMLLGILPFSHAQNSQKFTIKTVVIDPGHGGTDPGTCYGEVYEKDIVLDVALAFGNKIKKAFPNINVVYTRDKDVFVPLDDRGVIANKAKGDFFISIHVNSSKDKDTQATGTETYTLGLHKSEANLEVAKKENSVIMMEENYKQKYEGFDPKDDESYIMFGLCQYGFNILSISFASLLEDSFSTKGNKFKSRGVKQAGFLVLWRTSMPSVLTEIGFINNEEDRKVLTSDAGKNRVAESLFSAFKDYKNQVEVESHYSSSGNLNVKDVSKAVTNIRDLSKMQKYSPSSTAYAIQLLVSTRKVPINESSFGKNYKNIFEIKDGKNYKYLIGVLNSYNDVLSLRQTLRKSKFKDCFVVGVNKGKIIPFSEIKKIKKGKNEN